MEFTRNQFGKMGLILALLAWVGPKDMAMAKNIKHEIRTYMSYGLPIDPARIFTLEDLDFSYALGATLIDWNDSKAAVSGLADSWVFTGEKEITFHLSSEAKWSDGSTVSANDVVASLMRAKQIYRETLKSLFDLVESIEAKDSGKIVFRLNVPAAGSGVIKKLTEPMYGVLALKKDGSLDLTKTTGPYIVKSASESEVTLNVNRNWYKYRPEMAEAVIVRQPPKGTEPQNSFLQDDWVNLLTSSSLAPKELRRKYEAAHFSIWNRTLDKVFFLSPGPRLTNDDGRNLVKTLNAKMNRATVTSGLSGFNLSDQFFLSGYVLFDPEFHKALTVAPLSHGTKSRPLEILGIDSRVSKALRENIRVAIEEVTGVSPVFKMVSAGEAEKTRAAGQYDLWAGALPVNDANVEGALGYIFGFDPPFIPDAGTDERKSFHKRVLDAKKVLDQLSRNGIYRKVFSDAINEGSILPLFHFSTIAMAKNGIDLSAVPTTDETVTFSKVRFK
jgi:MarR-like DNA-binding transcriptional regulator SgrR of sgrS sRNA